MDELKALEDRIAMRRGNHQMYVLLMIWISLGGGILSYYEMKKFDQKQNLNYQQTLHPKKNEVWKNNFN